MSRKEHKRDKLLIEDKLIDFIRKFYQIRILQGFIMTLTGTAILLILDILISKLFKTGPVGNAILFWTGAAIIIWLIIILILLPGARRIGIIKRLDYREASSLVVEKHKEIEDKIINILELDRERDLYQSELYLDAIEQKTDEIKWYDFNSALPLRDLRRNLPWLVSAIAIIAIGYLIAPKFVRSGIASVINYNRTESKAESYTYRILNDSLSVAIGNDFTINVLPEFDPEQEHLKIRIGSREDVMIRKDSVFIYTINAVNRDIEFRFLYRKFESVQYKLTVLEKPELFGMSIMVNPPGYTGIKPYTVEDNGDLEVIAGSSLDWELKVNNTDTVVWMSQKEKKAVKPGNKRSKFSQVINEMTQYRLICKNNNGQLANYNYIINVNNDLFPEIRVAERIYEKDDQSRYFEGFIQDDYGFTKLEIIREIGTQSGKEEIDIRKNQLNQNFYYTLGIDTVSYVFFFRVYDNDIIKGPKYADSPKYELKIKSKEEIKEENKDYAERMNQGFENGISEVDNLIEKINKFRLEQLSGDMKPWEIQERIKEINELKDNVLNQLKMIEEQSEKYSENEKRLAEDEELMKRAEEIRDLMKNIIDEELKKLLEEYQKLAEEMKKEEVKDMSEQMELNMEKLKEQMEMSLELLKKYEVETELMQQAKEMDKLAEDVDKLKNAQDSAINEINKDLKDWNKDFEKSIEKNNELKNPLKTDELSEDREELNDGMKKLGEEKNNGFEKSKKGTSGKMKEVATKIRNMVSKSGEGGESVDLELLRQIRNSLIDFSLKQEEYNSRINKINTASPILTETMKEQKLLEGKFNKIKDSLKILGYKQPVITKMIGQEVFHVETSMKSLFEHFASNRLTQLRLEQNKIMSDINSIALKLDELINSLQNAMSSSTCSATGNQGFTDSKKKKSGEEKVGEMKSQQQSLKEQLKGMINQMKMDGQGKKDNKQLARMLAEREMMRKAMEKLYQEEGLGNDAREKVRLATEMMKDVEKDIVYNRLNDNTIKKDEWITTRLLEAEKAERERDTENQRESIEFKGELQQQSIPLKEQEKEKRLMEESLKYREVKLRKFYQQKYEEYIKKQSN